MSERLLPLALVPHDELLQELEDRYPIRMGIESDGPINLVRTYSRKGQFTHAELREAFRNRKQLALEHPVFVYNTTETTRGIGISLRMIQEIRAGQLSIPEFRQNLVYGINTARAALRE